MSEAVSANAAIDETAVMALEPADAAHPLDGAVDRLLGDVAALVNVLDEEASVAAQGLSPALQRCYARKLELSRILEASQASLRDQLTQSAAAQVPNDRLRRRLAEGDKLLTAALARNARALQAVTEGVRRIFEGAARTLAAEDIGYGSARLAGESGLFDTRSI
jgi:hypothetical protein